MFAPADLALIELARPQYGAFTRAQAKSCGHSARMIHYRVMTARWEILHPEVFAISGSPASWRRDVMAACLWSGGVAAGKAAGFLHGLPSCDDAPVEVVTTLRHKIMPRCGIVVHTTKRLPGDQICRVSGIPATSVERTLFDLCGQLSERRAAIALDNALFRSLTTIGDLDHCLYRTARRGRKGCATLRKLIKERWSLAEVPNSPLETVIFELLVEASLPVPELQLEIRDPQGRFVARPDFVYPRQRLVIEGHSRLWHEGQAAELADATRHDALVALGYRILYFTWVDVTQYRERTVAQIRRMLAERVVPRASERAPVYLSKKSSVGG